MFLNANGRGVRHFGDLQADLSALIRLVPLLAYFWIADITGSYRLGGALRRESALIRRHRGRAVGKTGKQ
jgi:hypothetical protein